MPSVSFYMIYMKKYRICILNKQCTPLIYNIALVVNGFKLARIVGT